MTRFVFLTKTRWDEPPRIRHQLARLLADAGHDVVFFEKPGWPWRRLPEPRHITERIMVVGHRELIHHKLRFAPPIHRLNAAVVRQSVKHMLAATGVGSETVIVNFNYDYWFLREMFPGLRLITIINDDFISRALFGIEAPLRWAMARTCLASDHVLTTAMPVQRQLAQYCRANLFWPWADQPYLAPNLVGTRDLLLFWGYINAKLDFGLVTKLADRLARERPGLRLLFVGPVARSAKIEFARLRERVNVDVQPATAVDDLPLERVLAALIPYRRNVPNIDAITLPNKAPQLLARGIPLLIAGMPHFIAEPFVFRLGEDADPAPIDELSARFADLQPAIAAFVARNSAAARLAQFLELAA